MTRIPSFLLIFVASLVSVVDAADDDDVLLRSPLGALSSGKSNALFEKIPSARSGVGMSYDYDQQHPMRRLYPFGWATGGVAIGDLNGDGKPDLFFAGTTGPNRVFENTSNFQFKEVTDTAKAGGTDSWGSSATMVDIDNDGDLEVYVTHYDAPNQFLFNIGGEGEIQFIDLAETYGVNYSFGSLSASFADVNSDGWLDLFIQTYHEEPENGRPEEIESRSVDGIARLKPPWERSYLGYFDQEKDIQFVEAGQSDIMLLNTGKSSFIEAGSIGLALGKTYGVSHVWWDLDEDQRPDLYTGQDSHGPDVLYRNPGGRFVAVESLSTPCLPWFARGAAAADLNGDLRMDLFAANRGAANAEERLNIGEPFPADVNRVLTSGGVRQVNRNVLLGSTGTQRFTEVARMAGLDQTGSTWSVKAADYDLDGRNDLFLTTGEAKDWFSLPSTMLSGKNLVGKTRMDLLEQAGSLPQRDRAFRSLGNWRFEDVSQKWGIDDLSMSYACSHGDLDGDGDLDLVVCRLGEEVAIYRNHSKSNRVVFEFEGKKTNSQGVGVEMTALVGNRGQIKQLYPSGGFKGADEAAIVVGMGAASKISRVSFRWPASGAIETFENLDAGFRYTVKEAASRTAPVAPLTQPPYFRGSNSLSRVGHKEVPFDLTPVQPLSPRIQSLSGPGVAAVDLDNDALSEIFLGGSRGHASRIVAQAQQTAALSQPFVDRLITETTASVFFDCDSDGDLDLYMASGGVEPLMDRNGAAWGDQLYLNLGQGQFAPAPDGWIPRAAMPTGAVAACDFDRDGDVDLFVGSQFTPGQYPQGMGGRLLRNDGRGRFTDVTLLKAPFLKQSGMISGAIWTDYDNDGWLDLLLARPWNSPQLLTNKEGSFSDGSATAGLTELTGVWQGVAGGDVDNDGDIDYVLTNRGTNTNTQSKPIALFRHPLENSPSTSLVEAYQQSGSWITSLGWADWIGSPAVAKIAPRSRDFTAKALPLLTESETRVATVVVPHSILLRNDSGKFQRWNLPGLSQVAPAFGVILSDLNYDGRCDCFLVQNDHSPSTRYPDPANAGVSQLLLGTGNSERPLRPVMASQSGLIVYGNGRGAAVADLNRDHRPDIVATLNGAAPAVFTNAIRNSRTQPLSVDLRVTGKPTAGARVEVVIPDFPIQLAEYYAGSGYLSQSAETLFFAAPIEPSGPATATIKWADGTQTERKIYFETPQE
ncbi:MAG: FG-GAP-like repeat-containing protein [Verrucomicrobiota bacterium]